MAKVMQVVNLASYALVAAIGISALVTSFSDKAIASPAPATDAADTFVGNAPKGWLVCKGLDSDNITTLMKVKLSNVTNRGMVLSTRTLDNQKLSWGQVGDRRGSAGGVHVIYTCLNVEPFFRARNAHLLS